MIEVVCWAPPPEFSTLNAIPTSSADSIVASANFPSSSNKAFRELSTKSIFLICKGVLGLVVPIPTLPSYLRANPSVALPNPACADPAALYSNLNGGFVPSLLSIPNSH